MEDIVLSEREEIIVVSLLIEHSCTHDTILSSSDRDKEFFSWEKWDFFEYFITHGFEYTDSLREDIVAKEIFSESLEIEFFPECFLRSFQFSRCDNNLSRWTELIVANPECHRGMEEEVFNNFSIEILSHLEPLTGKINHFCKIFLMIE